MSTTPSAGEFGRAPTELEPEAGAACVTVGEQEILLSEGVRWLEPDGFHVIKSLEFDVIAGGETMEEAVDKFIANLFDFAVYLGELDERAENEEDMFHLLAPRLLRVSQEFERAGEPLERRLPLGIKLRVRRGSREDVRQWHPLSRQHGSQLPSPV